MTWDGWSGTRRLCLPTINVPLSSAAQRLDDTVVIFFNERDTEVYFRTRDSGLSIGHLIGNNQSLKSEKGAGSELL